MRTIFLSFVCLGLAIVLVAFDGNNMDQSQHVSHEKDPDNIKIQRRDIPVDPGREQNIF